MNNIQRYLSKDILKDADKKIVLITGPRQSGKTTLTKDLFKTYDYLNFDESEDRGHILKKEWRRDVQAILFDELHKMPNWKQWIKGIYDTEGIPPSLFVTGSANLDTYSKVGDSLAGRYFQFRLYPIDVKEGVKYGKLTAQESFARIWDYSGFPEPFLEGTPEFYRRWKRSHLDIIIRQDFLDIQSLTSIKKVEILFDLMEPRIGSRVSYSNLAEDLQVDAKTVKSWLQVLENIYALFHITPYHKNISRSLLKEPKFYLYDVARVKDPGAKLENIVACALLKEISYIEDVYGHKASLHYLRAKGGQEIDFLVVINDQPAVCIEVKTTDDTPSKHFAHFRKFLGNMECIQLVLNSKREYDTADGIKIRRLIPWLLEFSFALD